MMRMKVSSEQLHPSQDFLKPGTVKFILECIENGDFERLPPDPIVRMGKNGELVAIDGHNLIAVRLHRGEEIEVHLAKSPEDGLPATSEANIQRNADLSEKFDFALAERTRLRKQGLNSFLDLIRKYPDLFEP